MIFFAFQCSIKCGLKSVPVCYSVPVFTGFVFGKQQGGSQQQRGVCLAVNTRAAKAALLASIMLLALLSFTACGSTEGFSPKGEPVVSDPEYQRTPPPIVMPEFVGSNQQANEDGEKSAVIDMTNVAQGYVAAKCVSPNKARVRIIKGDKSSGEFDDYPIDNDGTVNYFPLPRGNGTYTFALFIFIEDSPQGPLYEQFITATADVTLENEFVPFIIPNKVVDYNPSSELVQVSHEIAANCQNDLEVVQQIYAWIAANITYDEEKAVRLTGTVSEFYVPDPDETLRSGTGICYDYASLAAAMLRANAIPTKLVKGDVLTPDGATMYHAWNLIWVKEEGWIAVELPNSPSEWTRIDTTFAASGGKEISQFIGDGQNYTLISVH